MRNCFKLCYSTEASSLTRGLRGSNSAAELVARRGATHVGVEVGHGGLVGLESSSSAVANATQAAVRAVEALARARGAIPSSPRPSGGSPVEMQKNSNRGSGENTTIEGGASASAVSSSLATPEQGAGARDSRGAGGGERGVVVGGEAPRGERGGDKRTSGGIEGEDRVEQGGPQEPETANANLEAHLTNRKKEAHADVERQPGDPITIKAPG